MESEQKIHRAVVRHLRRAVRLRAASIRDAKAAIFSESNSRRTMKHPT
jgi:hypothetical protein